MKQFAYGILTGIFCTIGGVVTLFLAVAVMAPERMPPPAIGRVVHLDEKLRFIRSNPEIDPTVVAVGSSITWRNLSGREIERIVGPKRFLNGAAVYMQTHQTRKLARFLVRRYANVRTLLVLTNLPDFGNCTDDRDPMFNAEDAGRYAFRRWPETYFHLRYFAPRRYFDWIMTVDTRRIPFTGDVYIDEYGSGPVIVPPDADLGLRYKEREVDPFCVTKLAELSGNMTEWGLRTIIVFPPIHPDYRARYPESTAQVPEIAARLEAETEGDNTQILLMHDDPRFQPEDFYDAFHLQWPSAQRLSGIIADAALAKADPARDATEPPPDRPRGERDPPDMSLGAPPGTVRAADGKHPPAN